MEHIRDQSYSDKSFEAKLHGFKMSAPIIEQRWEPEEDKRMKDFAAAQFEKMKARATELKGTT